MEKYINLSIGSTPIKLPNSWETIAPADFLTIVEALSDLYGGSITPNEVLCRYTCSALGLDIAKIVNKHHAPDLLAIAQRVTFIFTPSAPVLAPSGARAQPPAPVLAASAASPPQKKIPLPQKKSQKNLAEQKKVRTFAPAIPKTGA